MTHILLAHAPDAETDAQDVAARLKQLGFEVRRKPRGHGALARRKLTAAADAAACVLVMSPRPDPELNALAQRARRAGKLAPWKGATSGRAWRQLAVSVRAHTQATPQRPVAKAKAPARTVAAAPAAKKRGFPFAALTLGVLLLAALGAGAYFLAPLIH